MAAGTKGAREGVCVMAQKAFFVLLGGTRNCDPRALTVVKINIVLKL